MSYEYETIDGQRVEKNVAEAFKKWRTAFKERWGLALLISSGTRTRAEQAELHRLYLAGKGNLAAAPGYSNHEESGPRGPRALDLRDSGADAGVTVAGSARSNWMKTTAQQYGFDPAGFRFSRVEPWHYEFTGEVGAGVTFKETVQVKTYQSELIRQGYDLGRWGADGDKGEKTVAALKKWQGDNGLVADGLFGVNSDAKMFPKSAPAATPAKNRTTADFGRVDVVQRALKEKYPLYAGRLVVDNQDGPKTIAAVKEFQRRAGLVQDGIAGPNTRRELGVK